MYYIYKNLITKQYLKYIDPNFQNNFQTPLITTTNILECKIYYESKKLDKIIESDTIGDWFYIPLNEEMKNIRKLKINKLNETI